MRFHLLLPICLLPSGFASHLVAASDSLESLAADLQRIMGRSIELRASPKALEDRSLPRICEALSNAFREVAADPRCKERLDKSVRSVVIDDFYGGGEHVVLAGEMLTVQSLNSEAGADSLRPLIVKALKATGSC